MIEILLLIIFGFAIWKVVSTPKKKLTVSAKEVELLEIANLSLLNNPLTVLAEEYIEVIRDNGGELQISENSTPIYVVIDYRNKNVNSVVLSGGPVELYFQLKGIASLYNTTKYEVIDI